MEFPHLKLVMAFALVLAVLLIARSLSKRDKLASSGLSLDDLLLGDDGKMSKAATVMLGAFGVTSWMMIYLTLTGKMSEGYLGIFVAAWIAPTVTRLFTNRPTDYAPPPPAPPQPAPTTIETKTTVTAPGGVTSPGGQT